MRLLDRPIIWIVIFGFLTAFVWEALQMPFYAMDHLSHRQMTMTCAVASIADAGLMALAYGLAARVGSPGVSNPMPLLIYVGAGLTATALVEQVVVSASWGWRYSEAMPVIPVYFATRNYLVRPSVRGMPPNLLGYPLFKQVYLQAED